MESLFLAIALIGVVWGIISLMNMVSYCYRKGIKINWAFLNLFMLKYISEYRRITTKENGKSGFWFYSFIVSMNSALVSVVIYLLFFK
ncbi:MAG: hypothetical protein V1720_20460 [bacterium]